MSNYPEMFVLRHGQTIWNLEGRHNSALTNLGIEQAKRQGEILKQVGCAARNLKCFSSPLERASHTAAIAMQEIDGVVVHDRRLLEAKFGEWEGRNVSELQPDLIVDNPTDADPFGGYFKAPGGESFCEVKARVQSFLDAVSEPTIVVTHGVTGRVLRGV